MERYQHDGKLHPQNRVCHYNQTTSKSTTGKTIVLETLLAAATTFLTLKDFFFDTFYYLTLTYPNLHAILRGYHYKYIMFHKVVFKSPHLLFFFFFQASNRSYKYSTHFRDGRINHYKNGDPTTDHEQVYSDMIFSS